MLLGRVGSEGKTEELIIDVRPYTAKRGTILVGTTAAVSYILFKDRRLATFVAVLRSEGPSKGPIDPDKPGGSASVTPPFDFNELNRELRGLRAFAELRALGDYLSFWTKAGHFPSETEVDPPRQDMHHYSVYGAITGVPHPNERHAAIGAAIGAITVSRMDAKEFDFWVGVARVKSIDKKHLTTEYYDERLDFIINLDTTIEGSIKPEGMVVFYAFVPIGKKNQRVLLFVKSFD